ncbi:MAG: DNA primase [Gammaproteobacteria bacterium]
MSSRIPQSFIDEVVTRTDIVELIDSHVPLKKKGKEFAACCPFHNEKTASFTVSAEKQFYHCFGCGAHGTALGFLMEYERLDFIEAVEVLAQQHGLEIPKDDTTFVKKDHQALYTLLEQANTYFQQNLRHQKHAVHYLKQRGVSGEIAAKYDLGFAADGFDNFLKQFNAITTEEKLIEIGLVKKNDKGNLYDRFRNRIVFPIKDRRGRVIGFGGRVLDDAVPKYLNSPETPVFHKSDALYGLYEARKSKLASKSLIVVEGYMDVVALAQHGIDNVVATLGTATTSQHIQQLYRCTQEIIFCFDGDRAGREAAWRAAQQTIPLFKDGLEAKFLFLPQGEDPDSLIRTRGKEIFLQYINDGDSISSFIFLKLSEDIDTRIPSGKARLAQIAKPLLEKFPNGVFKKLIFEELEKKVGIPISYVADQARPKISNTATNNKATPVRLAVAALLHQPSLALDIESLSHLEDCQLSGVPLLTQIIRIWKNEPELSHAALIERFRDQPEEQQIQKLMSWSPPELDEPEKALKDALTWIERKTQSSRVQELINKESTDGLTEDERQEFKHLLHQKAS